ncbi:hypothetical protein M378DRAFT_919205 [Amanita muscaria Koide BX008]|uniref:Protein kinase domain-containing protein n=1 Tax=Amanita muscaria (strain Koide BX008) TaxID=946122 RepID=A0A0C2T1Q2_AMAMK|nr:hypothetical protein M378DRAFT_919205 [Amanita muscaria Koide BX008]
MSPFLNRPARHFVRVGVTLESVLISQILDHNYILPVLAIHGPGFYCGFGNVNEQTEHVSKWLEGSSPNFITRIRVMLEIARIIRYIHFMNIALSSNVINTESIVVFLDSNLRAKIMFQGLFAWWSREASSYGHERFIPCTYEANVSAFANLFDKVNSRHNEKQSNRLFKDARQLIERCRAEDPKSRPTMEDVVKEMETWSLS